MKRRLLLGALVVACPMATAEPALGERKCLRQKDLRELSSPVRLSMLVGDGKSSSILLTHGMGTTNLSVSVTNVRTGQFVYCDIILVDRDSLRLIFRDGTPGVNAYRALLVF